MASVVVERKKKEINMLTKTGAADVRQAFKSTR